MSETESVETRAQNFSNSSTIKLVGMDQPFFTALAICVAVIAVLVACWAVHMADKSEEHAELAQYYAQDVELCIAKGNCPNPRGVTVPADPWTAKTKEAKK